LAASRRASPVSRGKHKPPGRPTSTG
jgi:hypothetical protein